MAEKGKPAKKSAADPIVSALQEELKRQGFYTGTIDGLMGESTKAAIDARDAKAASAAEDKRKDEDRELERLRLQQTGKTVDAEAAETARKTKARQDRAEASSTPWGVATQTAAGVGSPLAGILIGREMGGGINSMMDASQRSKNQVLQGLAEDRKAGLTTREGAKTAARISGAMPSSNALMRVGGRMLPHAALGGFMAGKGGLLLSQEDPEGSFYPEMANKAAGLGMIGAGTGLAERGIAYGVAPGVAPDARAMGVIESNQLRRNNAAPEPQGPNPGTRQALIADAKSAGIKGVSRMNKGQLAQALLKAGTKAPAFAGPAAAAALAFGMTPDRAEAADGSAPGGQLTEALTNAAAAGGVAAGTQAGISKLGQMIGLMAGPAMGAAGGAMAPGMIDGMTDYSPDEIAMAQNWLARNVPPARFGAVGDAYEMAQTPEPSPLRKALMAGR
jgi:hypothetical protein